MNNFALELWDDEASRCTFYTVRWEDAKDNETDKFFTKYDSLPAYKAANQELLSFILDSIGEDYGAIDALFNRFENEVIGLPNKGKVIIGAITFLFPNFPLRLYALRINNRSDIVVLFNGGIKSSQTIRNSRDLYLKWLEACQFARKIESALMEGEIIINEKERKIESVDKEYPILL